MTKPFSAFTPISNQSIIEKKTIFASYEESNYALMPFKYEWAWLNYKAMVNNFWTPEEVGAAGDILQWKSLELTEAEKHLYITVFSQLTTFDLLRTIDLSTNLIPIINAPEIVQAITFQAAQEAIHTHAYSYLIESLGLDQNDIYQRHKNVEELHARCAYAEEMGQMPELSAIKDNDPEALRSVLVSLVFYYCVFEGVWFYLNLLGPIQSLARRRLMTGTAKQFQYIARDEQLHVVLGTNFINAILKEHPNLLDEATTAKIIAMVEHSLILEDNFIDHALLNPVLGYNALDHKKTARFYASRWLKRIGIIAEFDGEQRIPWVDEMLSIRKEENFFEKRVTEYKVGTNLWGDEDHSEDDRQLDIFKDTESWKV